MTTEISPPVAIVQKGVRRVRLSDSLTEVNQGVGPSWKNYRVLGATRDGLAAAKEPVGKQPERYKLVEPGTIFYNPMRILIGSIAFVEEGQEPGITSPDYVVFKSNPGMIHSRWLYYWLRSDQGAAFIKTLARGAVRERMLFRRLAGGEILLPPYEAQKKFATEVLAVERARAAAEAQLKAANALPAAYLRAVFNSPEARRWPKTRLGEILKLRNEVVHPRDNPKGPATFVGLEHVESGTGARTGSVAVEMSELTGRKPRFYKDDIVYGYLRPYLNKVWIAEYDGLCSVDQYVYTVDGTKADSTLIAWFLRSPVYLERAPISTTPGQLPRIRIEEVASVEINLPALDEQKRISTRLTKKMEIVERNMKTLQEQLAAINKLPAALLRRAFSGET